MTNDSKLSAEDARRKRVAEAGVRARAESDARRQAAEVRNLPTEKGGRAGPDPTRYGDWEKDGVVSDF